MVAIQFKCTYNPYRKLTVWHSASPRLEGGLGGLRECYPLAALDNLVSTYDMWYNLYKSMRKTITVDQANIALTRKQFSEQLISALADYGDMPADSEAAPQQIRKGLHSFP